MKTIKECGTENEYVSENLGHASNMADHLCRAHELIMEWRKVKGLIIN